MAAWRTRWQGLNRGQIPSKRQYNDGIVAILTYRFANENGGELTNGQGWHASTLAQKFP
jgi:hypothetical protein